MKFHLEATQQLFCYVSLSALGHPVLSSFQCFVAWFVLRLNSILSAVSNQASSVMSAYFSSYSMCMHIQYVCMHVCVSLHVRYMCKKRGHLQRIFGRNTFEGRQVTDVLVMEPFDFEVKIHVFGTFAQAVLVMLCNAN